MKDTSGWMRRGKRWEAAVGCDSEGAENEDEAVDG